MIRISSRNPYSKHVFEKVGTFDNAEDLEGEVVYEYKLASELLLYIA